MNDIHIQLKEGWYKADYISETKVLHSNAGYYIGHEYKDRDFDAWLPYDRISGYYATREAAEAELANYKKVWA